MATSPCPVHDDPYKPPGLINREEAPRRYVGQRKTTESGKVLMTTYDATLYANPRSVKCLSPGFSMWRGKASMTPNFEDKQAETRRNGWRQKVGPFHRTRKRCFSKTYDMRSGYATGTGDMAWATNYKVTVFISTESVYESNLADTACSILLKIFHEYIPASKSKSKSKSPMRLTCMYILYEKNSTDKKRNGIKELHNDVFIIGHERGKLGSPK